MSREIKFFTLFIKMNHKLLLVKCITLLFRESQLPGGHENSATLVRNVIANIKEAQISIGLDHEREVTIALKKMAITMCETPPDHEHDVDEALQQLKVACGEDETLFDSFREGIEKELTENRTKKMALNLRRSLNEYFREEKIQEIIFNASNKLRFNRGQVMNMKQFVAETVALLEPYQVDSETKDPAIVASVNLAMAEEVKTIFKNVQKAEQGGGILRTGWQGVNRMWRGGFRRGQEVVIGALQHNFKTGFSLGAFIGVALFNTPETAFPEILTPKKPLLYRVSFEDDLELNFQYMYEVLMAYDGRENEIVVKTKEDFEAMTAEELEGYIDKISAYVMERMRVNGFEVIMERVNPSNWTYMHLCNRMLELESDGYEVFMCMADYLPMLPTTGCLQGPAGTDMQDMYRRIRNFMSA